MIFGKMIRMHEVELIDVPSASVEELFAGKSFLNSKLIVYVAAV